MREIVFDTETTGFDPLNGDRMVEIGCIELVGRIPTGESFHRYFNPQRPMPRGAQDVHGLGDDFLADKPLFADVVAELLEFIGDAPLVAHNANFDFGFLDMELGKCGHPVVDRARMVDTLALARVAHPMAKNSLDALCSRYGIDRSHRVKHGALLDAELLASVYIELTGGRQIGLGLDASAAEVELIVEVAPRASYAGRTPRFVTAEPAELARHAEYVAGIKDALWNEGAGRI